MKIQITDSFLESLYYLGSWRNKLRSKFRQIKWWFRPQTRVRPRYLSNGWCDRDVQLAHYMFEILSIFIEDECSPGFVEWYGAYPHMIDVDGKSINVRDEMQDLYDWWHNIFMKYEPPVHNYDMSLNRFIQVLNGEEATDEERGYMDFIHNMNKEEDDLEQELQNRLHRILNIRRYMWT